MIRKYIEDEQEMEDMFIEFCGQRIRIRKHVSYMGGTPRDDGQGYTRQEPCISYSISVMMGNEVGTIDRTLTFKRALEFVTERLCG